MPESEILVKISGITLRCLADAKGHFENSLCGLPAGRPYRIRITGDGEEVDIADVIVF